MVRSDLEKLVSLWFSTHRILREKVQADHAIDPLSVLRMETLRLVNGKRAISMREIASCFGIQPSSATSLVAGLVKSGDLVRRHSRSDHRIVQLHITGRGRASLEKTRKIMQNKLQGLLKVLTESERQQLLKIFSKLTHDSRISK